MRLFVAVEPDDGARRVLAQTTADLRQALRRWNPCVRWVSSSRMHLTLHFLGEVDSARLDALRAALGWSLPGPAFDVTLSGAGTFASRGRLRTLWIGAGDGCARLVEAHGEIGRRFAAGGWPVEDRPFSPHLTLARIRPEKGRRTAGLAAAVAALDVPPVRWSVDEVVLLSSDLGGPEPVYRLQHRLPFGRREPGGLPKPEADR